MSDDEADPELLELLRQHISKPTSPSIPETRVLESAEYVYNNSIDVALDMAATKAAATSIYSQMQKKSYSTKTWSSHDLHPQSKDASTVNFIFTMDLLNFSFWSLQSEEERFAVEYRGKRWTGYWSLVAALQRGLEEGYAITSSDYWQDEGELTEEVFAHIFRSCTTEAMPLLSTRLALLREAGTVLYEKYDCSFANCIKESNHSAAALVNLLAASFPCFNDVVSFEKRKEVRLLKRAQICVADLWAAFEGEGWGEFHDIDKLTMFADYRIPQLLNTLGCLWYAPALESAIKRRELIESGHSWEVQLRGKASWSAPCDFPFMLEMFGRLEY
ncbi:hypothetical protein DSL72_007444 [Monilinia vaccinii-corymbosi]|uniref:Queuosine 5'-phosphate N-glycosylase/hydrolase n=1 Tax=Monilinia vaccinii-corymbosi TaxID=61207 RepID=A0A8A3PLU0_9HELO|nr:hypothetical protein DSL72_007444 [Monilinia vaccinii-corymbosi]